MHYCKICGFETREGLAVLLKHVLDVHADEIPSEERVRYKEWLERWWRCEDCANCGVVFVFDRRGAMRMKKACPADFLWNHPDPLKCPSFIPKA